MTSKEEIIEKINQSVLNSPYADGSLTAREDRLIDLAIRKTLSYNEKVLAEKDMDIKLAKQCAILKCGVCDNKDCKNDVCSLKRLK